MVADIFEDFNPPSKKSLATPLDIYNYNCRIKDYSPLPNICRTKSIIYEVYTDCDIDG